MVKPHIFGRERRWIWVVLILASSLLLGRLTHRDEVVGRDRPIVLDDFSFAVQDVRLVDEPGESTDHGSDRDRSMVVSLKIMNRARRVSFSFHPDWAVLVDSRGGERRISPIMQRKHDQRNLMRSPLRAPIKAGESAEVDLVFEAPPETAGCQFRLSSGGPIGDFLDGFLSGPRRIALDR
jgi:hypothetical protein